MPVVLLALLGATELPHLGNVEWIDVVSTPGCFFFAGPGDLGRDDPLGTSARVGPHGELSFGRVPFDTLGPGHYVRGSRHDFNGPWTARQTLEGTWTSGVFFGTYTYREGRAGEDEGHCTIDASVRIRA